MVRILLLLIIPTYSFSQLLITNTTNKTIYLSFIYERYGTFYVTGWFPAHSLETKVLFEKIPDEIYYHHKYLTEGDVRAYVHQSDKFEHKISFKGYSEDYELVYFKKIPKISRFELVLDDKNPFIRKLEDYLSKNKNKEVLEGFYLVEDRSNITYTGFFDFNRKEEIKETFGRVALIADTLNKLEDYKIYILEHKTASPGTLLGTVVSSKLSKNIYLSNQYVFDNKDEIMLNFDQESGILSGSLKRKIDTRIIEITRTLIPYFK